MIVSFWVDCGLREQVYEKGIEAGMTEEQATDFAWYFEPEMKLEVLVNLHNKDYEIFSIDGRELQ